MGAGASTSSRRAVPSRSIPRRVGLRSTRTWQMPSRSRTPGSKGRRSLVDVRVVRRAARGDEQRLHGSGDALSTGAVKSRPGSPQARTALHWKWEGRIFAPSAKGWDKATARLTTAFRSGEEWIGLYDGASDISENYEERCGMARSTDLRNVGADRVRTGDRRRGWTGDGPLRGSVVVGDTVRFVSRHRSDGGHESARARCRSSVERAALTDAEGLPRISTPTKPRRGTQIAPATGAIGPTRASADCLPAWSSSRNCRYAMTSPTTSTIVTTTATGALVMICP